MMAIKAAGLPGNSSDMHLYHAASHTLHILQSCEALEWKQIACGQVLNGLSLTIERGQKATGVQQSACEIRIL